MKRLLLPFAIGALLAACAQADPDPDTKNTDFAACMGAYNDKSTGTYPQRDAALTACFKSENERHAAWLERHHTHDAGGIAITEGADAGRANTIITRALNNSY